jgi:hypothetical protein
MAPITINRADDSRVLAAQSRLAEIEAEIAWIRQEFPELARKASSIRGSEAWPTAVGGMRLKH